MVRDFPAVRKQVPSRGPGPGLSASHAAAPRIPSVTCEAPERSTWECSLTALQAVSREPSPSSLLRLHRAFLRIRSSFRQAVVQRRQTVHDSSSWSLPCKVWIQPFQSIAMAYGQHKNIINDFDLIVLAPQMASMYDELKHDCEEQGVKSATTSGREYVGLTRDPEKALEFALALMEN